MTSGLLRSVTDVHSRPEVVGGAHVPEAPKLSLTSYFLCFATGPEKDRTFQPFTDLDPWKSVYGDGACAGGLKSRFV
jgi:hypothetical protein